MKFLRPVEVAEKKMLRLFKNYATPFLPRHDLSHWELLAIAQHHGLPTRLLDWSRNPLVAAYFAVERELDDDSAIYVLKGKKFINIEGQDPFRIKAVSKFIPSHITPRITAQSGLFTVHPKPSKPFEGATLDKLVVIKTLRKQPQTRPLPLLHSSGVAISRS